jgi:hypothetical protein
MVRVDFTMKRDAEIVNAVNAALPERRGFITGNEYPFYPFAETVAKYGLSRGRALPMNDAYPA